MTLATTVLGIAEARSTLPSLVERLDSGMLDDVIIGSHRKPQAVIVPYGRYAARTGIPHFLDTVVARARLVHRLAGASGITAVSVFGSVARGDDTEESDLDLLVDTLPETGLFALAQFELDMELLFGRPVDVVARASLDAARDRSILADEIAL
jgi:predicted nucleotidyltransferase